VANRCSSPRRPRIPRWAGRSARDRGIGRL
jgi:hypothetical protein